jgi:hypothetical protein
LHAGTSLIAASDHSRLFLDGRQLPNLVHIKISAALLGCSGVMEALVLACPDLQELHLIDCWEPTLQPGGDDVVIHPGPATANLCALSGLARLQKLTVYTADLQAGHACQWDAVLKAWTQCNALQDLTLELETDRSANIMLLAGLSTLQRLSYTMLPPRGPYEKGYAWFESSLSNKVGVALAHLVE